MTRAREVADTSAPLGRRFAALLSCLDSFAPFGFDGTLAYLASAVGAGPQWTPSQISTALDLLIQERVRYIEFDAEWIKDRRTRKQTGQRVVSWGERATRDAQPWLTWPRDKAPIAQDEQPTEVFPFRPSHRVDFDAVLAVMPTADLEWASCFHVRVDGDRVLIPGRIYNPTPAPGAVSRLSDRQELMMHCLYTRHHDGYVRQRYLGRLLEADEPWVAPYVVALVGDYVVEIVEAVASALSQAPHGSIRRRCYGRFESDNAEFITLVRQRVWSYWRQYYSADFRGPVRDDRATRPEYPGFVALRAVQAAAADSR